MARVSRVAVGTIQLDADPEPMVWALMEALRRSGLQVQSFHSRACFPARQAAAAVTGLTPRHLDSWLMSPEMCRDIFLRGAHAADLAVVEGQFEPAMAVDGGGKLETLCQWLSLPRLVVLDAAKLCHCRLPPKPKAEGLLLDQVADVEQFVRLSTDLESLWDVPVIGALDRSPRLSGQLGAVARGGRLSQEICRELGDQLMRYWQVGRLLEIAGRWEMPDVTLQQLCPEPTPSRLSLAVAYDEAFNCYFPDTLDWLELRGASVVDFSPLREESLPAGTDIVYLGCGQPERHAAALAENHCMKAALRNHLRAGRRIYAEGGGLAYLCQQMESLDGVSETDGGDYPGRRAVDALPLAAAADRSHPRATELAGGRGRTTARLSRLALGVGADRRPVRLRGPARLRPRDPWALPGGGQPAAPQLRRSTRLPPPLLLPPTARARFFRSLDVDRVAQRIRTPNPTAGGG